jgi:hypothetical protein
VDEGDGTGPQELYKAVAYTFWCSRYRANNIASLPYYVFPMEVEEDDKDLQVEWGIDLRPLLWVIETWLSLMGAAYMYKLEEGRTLEDLIILNANTMSVKTWDRWGRPTQFEQKIRTERQTFPADEIVYFRTFDSKDDVREGTSSGEVAQIPGTLVRNANEWASSFFGNGAIPAVLLVTDDAVPPSEKERIKGVWNKMAQGVRKAFSTVVLERGLKPVVVGQPIKDLAMPELEETKRLQILAAHDLPPGLIEPRKNRAESESLRLAAWQDHLEPYCEVFIEPALNEQLFNPLGLRVSFQYNLLEVYQANELEKGEKAAFFISGVMLPAYDANTVSIDEVRATIDAVITSAGLPPLEAAFEPEERTPSPLLAAANEAEDEGASTDIAENIENRTQPKALPKVTAPRWGHHRVSMQN